MSEESRSHETRIEIDAPPEMVWKALSEAEQITTWFAPFARVEPGPDGSMVGGSIWLSWGPGVEGTSTIEIWEPGRHSRAVDPRKIAVDYYLEAKEGGGTVLRVVTSGFGRGANWDDEYEGTRKGWPIFLRVLKHGIERHPGEKARQVSIVLPVAAPPEEQWTQVLAGQLDGLGKGDRFAVQLPTGDRLEGTLNEAVQRGYVAAVVENWNDALWTVFCEKHGETGGLFTTGLCLYGDKAGQGDAIEARWRASLQEVFNVH
jgi:uncharacterized protein YndB with AHSA1/START domain